MKNELAVVENFKLASIYDEMDEDLKAELAEEMEDLDDEGGIDCRHIKIPTGKSKAFEVESDDPDDPEMVKEVEAVILFTHKLNTRWEGDYGGDNKRPVCSSMDAKCGINMETGEKIDCDRCVYNQFREDGSGKDCKNMRRIYMMLSGRPNLYLLSVPPTSMKEVGKQLKRIMGSNAVPYTHMVVTFKLQGATSKNGNDFNKILVEKKGLLSPEQFEITKAARAAIKLQYKNVAITDEDYNTEKPEEAGFVAAEDLGDENLPFN